ncbi:hypothetical protein FZ025_09700 [Xanthomonas hyacinthi]|uniref:Avirulence protein n=1 Tax=Xanthomonas hyacinthi TaxID=56455 RepID=A0A2S7EQ75_9XANT|nr:hypothetical protein XhyaCFBP1156_19370 [Xanthomonas hyacinthi]QGY76907.1 hypothetical protein FZ025_09700 [Xanthomonas hyacinthi]
MTDGMELCVAVAVGGESQTKGKGKARVFHVMPENRMAQWEIKDYIQKLKKDGYTAKVAIHGGDNTSDASMKKIMAINTVLQQLSVPVEFSAVGDGCKANGNGPLGAVVEEDGSVRFVTKLVT